MRLTPQLVQKLFPETISVRRSSGSIEKNWRVMDDTNTSPDLDEWHMYAMTTPHPYPGDRRFGTVEIKFEDMLIPCELDNPENYAVKLIRLQDIIKTNPYLDLAVFERRFKSYLVAYWTDPHTMSSPAHRQSLID
jgi:hypothetical protein